MASIQRISPGVAMAVFGATLCCQAAVADPTKPDSLTIPINQVVMRNGAIRYTIWVKVGDRSVEALLDTGSTGLRVLPAVVPGDLMGIPLQAGFATGETMKGLAIRTQVEIGPLSAKMPIEVVDGMVCSEDHPVCGFTPTGRDLLIAADGITGHGFSAILGIGFTSRSQDIPNPLEALGAAQWIVDLPRPDADEPGHLILKPEAALQAQFKLHSTYGSADFFGCLRGESAESAVCGTIALDTGAPEMLVVTGGDEPDNTWTPGTPAVLKFPAEAPLPFQVGERGTMTSVTVLPYKKRFRQDTPFILTGAYPYFTYDVLYDAPAKKVGLKAREPAKPRTALSAEAPAAGDASGATVPPDPAPKMRHRQPARAIALQ